MKNGDMPAMACEVKATADEVAQRRALRLPVDGTVTYTGLTKREYFAAMAMQGLCTNGTDNILVDYYAAQSVMHADALLKALGEE